MKIGKNSSAPAGLLSDVSDVSDEGLVADAACGERGRASGDLGTLSADVAGEAYEDVRGVELFTRSIERKTIDTQLI